MDRKAHLNTLANPAFVRHNAAEEQSKMQLLFIICEASVDDRVCAIIEKIGAPGYTRFTGAMGHGPGGRREGTPIWPGLNSIILASMPNDLVPQLREAVEALQQERNGRLAIKVFAVPSETVL